VPFFSWPGLSTALQCSIGIDRRSLALFRVLLGWTIIYDIWDRSYDLETFYSDEGILPRHLVISSLGDSWAPFDFYLSSGSVFWLSICFCFHAFLGFLILIGYNTKVVNLVAFVFQHSIIWRVQSLSHGGDLYLNCMLFISLFLPLGEYYSIDALFSKETSVSFSFDIRPQDPCKRSESDSNPAPRHGFLQLFLEELRESWSEKKKASNFGLFPQYMNEPNQLKETKQEFLTKNLIVNMATCVAMFQVFALYFYAHFMKTGKPWNEDFTAAFYALKLDYFRLAPGDMFLNFPLAMKFLTWAVKKWQFWGAVFLLVPLPSPVYQQYLRFFGSLGFFAMHLGFGICLRLDTFFWISIGGVYLTLPPVFWDEVLFPCLSNFSYSPFRTESVMIKYPRNCASSRRSLQILSTFFMLPSTNVQSYVSAGNFHESDHLWIFVDETGKSWSGLDGWIRIMKLSPILFGIGWFCGLSFVQPYLESLQTVYSRMHSYENETFGTKPQMEQTALPEDLNEEFMVRPRHTLFKRRSAKKYWIPLMKATFSGIFCFFVLWFIFCSNEQSISRLSTLPVSWPPEGITSFFRSIDINQHWSMFAPQPPNTHWYYVMEGDLQNNHVVDLWKRENLFRWEGGNDWKNNESISWEQPNPFAASIGNHRWFKFYENGVNYGPRSKIILPYFGSWICRKWNSKRESSAERLKTFRIWYMSQDQHLDGSRGPASRHMLWRHYC